MMKSQERRCIPKYFDFIMMPVIVVNKTSYDLTMYRVSHLLVNLDWNDFECSTILAICLISMSISRDRTEQTMEHPKYSSKPNPVHKQMEHPVL